MGGISKRDLSNARQEAINQTSIQIDLYTDKLEIGKKKTKQNNVIFISHAVEDKEVAEEVKKQIENVMGTSIEVFVSSVPDSIDPGSEWLDRIIECLMKADAILVIITNTSINKRFVWFEIGFFLVTEIRKKMPYLPTLHITNRYWEFTRAPFKATGSSIRGRRENKSFF